MSSSLEWAAWSPWSRANKELSHTFSAILSKCPQNYKMLKASKGNKQLVDSLRVLVHWFTQELLQEVDTVPQWILSCLAQSSRSALEFSAFYIFLTSVSKHVIRMSRMSRVQASVSHAVSLECLPAIRTVSMNPVWHSDIVWPFSLWGHGIVSKRVWEDWISFECLSKESPTFAQ